MIEQYRYRKKGDKIQVQKLEGKKWISRTLPSAKDTFIWLCPGYVSYPQAQTRLEEPLKASQKGAQDLLREHLKEDTNKEVEPLPDLSKEEIERLSAEVSLEEIEGDENG